MASPANRVNINYDELWAKLSTYKDLKPDDSVGKRYPAHYLGKLLVDCYPNIQQDMPNLPDRLTKLLEKKIEKRWRNIQPLIENDPATLRCTLVWMLNERELLEVFSEEVERSIEVQEIEDSIGKREDQMIIGKIIMWNNFGISLDDLKDLEIFAFFLRNFRGSQIRNENAKLLAQDLNNKNEKIRNLARKALLLIKRNRLIDLSDIAKHALATPMIAMGELVRTTPNQKIIKLVVPGFSMLLCLNYWDMEKITINGRKGIPETFDDVYYKACRRIISILRKTPHQNSLYQRLYQSLIQFEPIPKLPKPKRFAKLYAPGAVVKPKDDQPQPLQQAAAQEEKQPLDEQKESVHLGVVAQQQAAAAQPAAAAAAAAVPNQAIRSIEFSYHPRVTRWFGIMPGDEIPFPEYSKYKNDDTLRLKHAFPKIIDSLIGPNSYCFYRKEKVNGKVRHQYQLIAQFQYPDGTTRRGVISYSLVESKQLCIHRYFTELDDSQFLNSSIEKILESIDLNIDDDQQLDNSENAVIDFNEKGVTIDRDPEHGYVIVNDPHNKLKVTIFNIS